MQTLSSKPPITNHTFSERNRRIYSMYRDELRTMSYIARLYGLTRQRVQQLIKRMEEYGYGANRFLVPAVFLKDMILPPRLHNFFREKKLQDMTIKDFVEDYGIYYMYVEGGIGERSFDTFIQAVRVNGYEEEAQRLEKDVASVKSGDT